MKKILFAVVAMVALSVTSCGNSCDKNSNGSDTTDTAVVDTVDTTTVDSTVCPL